MISGPTALCARLGITDLSSKTSMVENGWDLTNIDTEKRLTLTDRTCMNILRDIDQFKSIVQDWSASKISTSFWADGKATLRFGNCNFAGRVFVLLDGTEIANTTHRSPTSITFNVADGSTLTIKTDNLSIIRLFDLKLECGELVLFQNYI